MVCFMDRRAFIGGLLASAAVRTWPFRVFSFPSKVSIAPIISSESVSIRFVRMFDPIQRKMVNRWYTGPLGNVTNIDFKEGHELAFQSLHRKYVEMCDSI